MKNVNRKIVHSTLYLALAACLSNAAFAATPSSVTDNGNDGNVAANTIDDDPTLLHVGLLMATTVANGFVTILVQRLISLR